jgi:hypothetical protein
MPIRLRRIKYRLGMVYRKTVNHSDHTGIAHRKKSTAAERAAVRATQPHKVALYTNGKKRMVTE